MWGTEKTTPILADLVDIFLPNRHSDMILQGVLPRQGTELMSYGIREKKPYSSFHLGLQSTLVLAIPHDTFQDVIA